MYFYILFLKHPSRKYLNFTIKENMRGEHEIRQDKDKRFRNAFSRTLVITLSLVMLVTLAKVSSLSGKIFQSWSQMKYSKLRHSRIIIAATLKILSSMAKLKILHFLWKKFSQEHLRKRYSKFKKITFAFCKGDIATCMIILITKAATQRSF